MARTFRPTRSDPVIPYSVERTRPQRREPLLEVLMRRLRIYSLLHLRRNKPTTQI